MPEMNRKLIGEIGLAAVVVGSSLGLCLLLLALFFAGFLFRDSPEDYVSRRNFDPVAWQDSTRVFSEETIRLQMIDDLLRRHSFEEMTRSGVVGLLGEPEDTPYFHEYDLVYWLGPERGPFGIDSEWLIFKLDSNGTVKELKTATD